MKRARPASMPKLPLASVADEADHVVDALAALGAVQMQGEARSSRVLHARRACSSAPPAGRRSRRAMKASQSASVLRQRHRDAGDAGVLGHDEERLGQIALQPARALHDAPVGLRQLLDARAWR